MSSYTPAAKVVQTRNLDGSVVCKAADALPFLLQVGQQVYFVPPSLRGPRTAEVVAIQQLREDAWEVAFSNIASIDTAQQLLGCNCLVESACLPDILAEQRTDLLVGFAVEDIQLGFLGTVCKVGHNPAQELLEIEGPHGQVLVPYVQEFIQEVNEGTKTIYTTVPESLLNLNAGD